MDDSATSSDPRSDAELLRVYRDPGADDDGEAFNVIYCRYRNEVRRYLENEGLSPKDAENRVGAVFILALDHDAADAPASLAAVLSNVARQVARDPNWQPF